MNIELKKVTPAMAERWLKKNHPKSAAQVSYCGFVPR
jgi:hypothetical protein